MIDYIEIVSGIAIGLGSAFVAVKAMNKKAEKLDVEPEKQKPEQFRVVERKDTVKVIKKQKFSYEKRVNAGKTYDHTKHKSLQPGNIKTIQEVINKTVHDVKNFEHKFFGTVLECEGKILIDSMPKKLHQFEVVDGVCYIDGREIKLHPDDLVKLARSVE